MTEHCAQHPVLIQRLDHLATALDANTATSNRLLERLNAVATDSGVAAAEVAHLKADMARLDRADGDQWGAINALRAKVYTGVGLALAGSAAVSLVAAWIK